MRRESLSLKTGCSHGALDVPGVERRVAGQSGPGRRPGLSRPWAGRGRPRATREPGSPAAGAPVPFCPSHVGRPWGKLRPAQLAVLIIFSFPVLYMRRGETAVGPGWEGSGQTGGSWGKGGGWDTPGFLCFPEPTGSPNAQSFFL